MRTGLFVLVLGACASAEPQQITIDAPAGPSIDAPSGPPIDAEVPCNPGPTQLLKNPSFDDMPAGTAWTGTPVDPMYPLITGDGDGTTTGIVEHTPPYDAWMGGFATANANDQLYQDVAIPERTSMLVLSGMHDVRSGDTTASDTAEIALVKLDGTVVEVAFATDSTKKQTAWTAFSHTFAATDLSGQTLRFRIKTHNNATADTETSFYFDTFTLVATHCQ